MQWTFWLPFLLLATSLIPGLVIFRLSNAHEHWRLALNLGGALLKVGLVIGMLIGVAAGHEYEWRMPFLPGIDLILRADALPLFFISLSAGLWLTTTIYAVSYLGTSPRQSQFFGFFSLCVTSTVGIALAGNLVTLLVFYELLTVATYPLVINRGTPRALAAGRTYLLYLVPGGTLLLVAVVWLSILAGPVEFARGGALEAVAGSHRTALQVIFGLFVVSFGVKAAIIPLHGWLPQAMVAPAPVSALLHAVAVVKAGVYGIVRVIFDLYGIELASDLSVLPPLAAVAAATIVFGSVRALTQDELKRRLAYSTVSQLSYVLVGVAVVGLGTATGGLVHIVHQGVMKVTLFYCAGNIAETVGVHHVSEMGGIGRRMPVTMAAFTICALGMIGLPPTAGFVTKWQLGTGAFDAGEAWLVGVLVVSTVLNAAYFLPIVYRAWFEAPAGPWESHRDSRYETSWVLLLPPVVTATVTLAIGLFAGSPFSPLQWAEAIAREAYDLPAGLI